MEWTAMDWTTIAQFGAAFYIASKMDRKVDALIVEFKESNEVTFGLLRTLVGQGERHERRIKMIEQHLNQRLAEEDEEEETQENGEIKGFARQN